MRLVLLLILLASACEKACPLVCQDDNDCAAFATCYQHVACLSQCDNIVCGGKCVDSFHNCGNCGTACAAGQVCGRSGCAAVCDTGLTNCSGSCYDQQSDRLNCGGCGHICGGNEFCSGGKCIASCE